MSPRHAAPAPRRKAAPTRAFLEVERRAFTEAQSLGRPVEVQGAHRAFTGLAR